MTDLIAWLETHDELAGWAQFWGATIALWVTWWIARGEVRARRVSLTNRLKATMLLAYLMHEGAKETLADIRSRNMPKLTAAIQIDNNDLFEKGFHTFDQVTSSFMANNHIALIGWKHTLNRLYDGIQKDEHPEAEKILSNAMLGIRDICANIGREVTRLGGRFEVHDDLSMRQFLKPNLRAKVFLLGLRLQQEQKAKAAKRLEVKA